MPLTIDDELLDVAGMSEDQARIEIACRLFESGKLTLPAAVRWSGLDRSGMERELLARGVPLYRPTAQEVEADRRTLRDLGN